MLSLLSEPQLPHGERDGIAQMVSDQCLEMTAKGWGSLRECDGKGENPFSGNHTDESDRRRRGVEVKISQ
jgi:hypothetical protein